MKPLLYLPFCPNKLPVNDAKSFFDNTGKWINYVFCSFLKTPISSKYYFTSISLFEENIRCVYSWFNGGVILQWYGYSRFDGNI